MDQDLGGTSKALIADPDIIKKCWYGQEGYYPGSGKWKLAVPE